MRVSGKVEILAGLKAGDRVVTAGQSRLMRGERQPVRVVELGNAGGNVPAQASLPAASAARPAP
jgi:membrane fusion protein (multidrug efflux system)